MPSRNLKAIISGSVLLLGFFATWDLAYKIGALHILMAVPTLLGMAIFIVGYCAPTFMREWVEYRLRAFVGYLEFYLPASLLPAVRLSINLVSWLGLEI